ALAPALAPCEASSARGDAPTTADPAYPEPVFVDATCGGAGHTLALLEDARTRPRTVVAMDRDADAIAWAEDTLRPRADALGVRLVLVHAPFSSLAEVLDDLQITAVSAILADLGVSSHQLDTAARGFSFRADAPLDMRMDRSRGMSAADVLAAIEERELSRILREYGEEEDATRIARAIVAARPRTTAALADTVREAMSARQRRRLGARIHPATRTFQALRIHVNGELDELKRLLDAAPERLRGGGRLAIISFHSLEDRLVKQRFSALSRPPAVPRGLPIPESERPSAAFSLPLGRRGQTPGDLELENNPRSRSSRLRALERCT
ncbi:MAG: 16S rRNA (cytosine(1402)-N(4))-methyltransferase RsmH, partial [Myxococcales bacterium]|nr:16S rRNA (cytosine(1402)-N(4))-methyltransferase RsmH [Myxococcales bacterium]